MCLWGVDVSVAVWTLPYPVVLEMIERLRFEPRSMYRANAMGSKDWYGWGSNENLLLHISQGVRATAVASGIKEKHLPVFPAPGVEPVVEVHQPKDVRSVDFSVLFSNRS